MPEHPFAVQGIDHIVLRVQRLQRSLVFYRDVLGCPIEREQAELGLTQLRAGRSLIDLVTLDGPLGAGAPPGAGRNLEHFCLTVAPFEEAAVVAWLRARGVVVQEPGSRYGAQGEGRSFYIEDPDGNRVELKAASPAT
ncbi:MAG TPA: VOC family protein [Steroidobacteraceae bacterium]|jgi:catechol 2,3-dioxygenase-like lactoylglutathione lyase family enzyme|nr:VOC family protein [Steroidobacteraceae bacterium]